MKIRMFNKIIEIDENNPGVDYFLNEFCEFPTEAFMNVEYSRKCYEENRSCPKDIDAVLYNMSAKELKDVLKFAIIDTYTVYESMTGRSYAKYKECITDSIW